MGFKGLEQKLNGIFDKTKGSLKSLTYSAVIGASLFVGGASASAPQYEITLVEFPLLYYNSETCINHISNDNDVVGYYNTFDRFRKGDFISRKPYLLRGDIFYNFLGLPEDFFGQAIAISEIEHSDDPKVLLCEEDEVTGEFKESYWYYPYYNDLTPLGFKAHDINSNISIAGEDYFRIGRDIIKIRPDDSNDNYIGYCINDNDVVAGYIKTNDENPYNDIPFIWENNEITYLPIPEDAAGGCATRINNSNQIIGFVTYISPRNGGVSNRPCMWENEVYTNLLSKLTTL